MVNFVYRSYFKLFYQKMQKWQFPQKLVLHLKLIWVSYTRRCVLHWRMMKLPCYCIFYCTEMLTWSHLYCQERILTSWYVFPCDSVEYYWVEYVISNFIISMDFGGRPLWYIFFIYICFCVCVFVCNIFPQVMPMLKILYHAQEKNSHHIYMVLIVLLILSEDDCFNKATHEIVSALNL